MGAFGDELDIAQRSNAAGVYCHRSEVGGTGQARSGDAVVVEEHVAGVDGARGTDLRREGDGACAGK